MTPYRIKYWVEHERTDRIAADVDFYDEIIAQDKIHLWQFPILYSFPKDVLKWMDHFGMRYYSAGNLKTAILVDKFVDFSRVSEVDDFVLNCALEYASVEIFKRLAEIHNSADTAAKTIRHGDLQKLVGHFGEADVIMAIKYGKFHIARHLLRSVPATTNMYQPIIEEDNLQLFKHLESLGLPYDVEDVYYHKSRKISAHIFKSIDASDWLFDCRDVAYAKIIVQSGANIEVRGSNYETPLAVYAYKKQTALIDYFLSVGADPVPAMEYVQDEATLNKFLAVNSTRAALDRVPTKFRHTELVELLIERLELAEGISTLKKHTIQKI